MKFILVCVTVFSLYLSGCAVKPAPFITQMNSASVRIQVNYGLFGPNIKDAQVASLPLAEAQCNATKRTAVLISSFTRR